MSGTDPISLVALIISLVALILTLLQVAQQYIATASDYRHCSERTVGGWSRRSRRRFLWNELRFEVLFATPVISINILPSEKDKADPYAAPSTGSDALQPVEKNKVSIPLSSIPFSHSESYHSSSTGGARYVLHTLQGDQLYTSSQKPWFLDLEGTRPEAKCTWLSLLSDISATYLQVGIREHLLSYDFMPDGIKKPVARMDRKSYLTLMSLFQVSWQEGQGKEIGDRIGAKRETPVGAGPYCEVTSHNLINFGTVVSYQPADIQPTRNYYIISEKARSAMFNHFDLGFHIVLTQSPDEVYHTVLTFVDDTAASTIRNMNTSNNGWSPGLAEVIGCFAEPEMPKAVEHGTDHFLSIFSARSIGCILNDHPVVRLLLGESIEYSSPDAEIFRDWAKGYITFSSHPEDGDAGARLPTDQIRVALEFASTYVGKQRQLGQAISWSESRRALHAIRLLDKQMDALCQLIVPWQSAVEVRREFARLQIRLGCTLFQDTTMAAAKQPQEHGRFWRNFIGSIVAANYIKVCAGLGEQYPGSREDVRRAFVVNRLMRGILWHIHNGNNPSDHPRQSECSLNSRWLSDTSTIWID